MNRIIAIVGLAALALLASAAVASASVAVDNGVGFVGKGDVQTALKWNNADFDKNVGSLKFTASYTATYDNVLTCRNGVVAHVPVVSTGTGDLQSTQVKSSNGKQITGWNLSGAGSAVEATNDTSKIVAALFTACGDGTIPTGLDMPSTPTVTFDGLKVNGIDLPNTPVVVPAV
jgi:hypothetical protein